MGARMDRIGWLRGCLPLFCTKTGVWEGLGGSSPYKYGAPAGSVLEPGVPPRTLKFKHVCRTTTRGPPLRFLSLLSDFFHCFDPSLYSAQSGPLCAEYSEGVKQWDKSESNERNLREGPPSLVQLYGRYAWIWGPWVMPGPNSDPARAPYLYWPDPPRPSQTLV